MKKFTRRVIFNAHISTKVFSDHFELIQFKEPMINFVQRLNLYFMWSQLVVLFIKPKTNPKTKLKLNLILSD